MSSGKQKKICQGCQVEISIGKYLEVQDNLFMHSRCFKCCDCGVEIGEKPFLPRGNGFACGDCVDRSKRTGSSTTTTTTTGSSSRSVSSHSDSPSSSSSPASSGDRKICAKCNDEILAVVFHNLHGKQYHTDWFVYFFIFFFNFSLSISSLEFNELSDNHFQLSLLSLQWALCKRNRRKWQTLLQRMCR